MKNKRILSLVLAFAMLLGTFSFAFADEPASNPKIDWLVKEGLVKGDAGTGDLRLADPIKRSEVAAMVVRAIGKEELAESVKGVKTFPDVLNAPSDNWANGYINVAAAEGIVNGYPNGTFKPGNHITKAEVVSMMVRVMGGLTEEEQKLAVGPNWATIYLVKAKEMKILDGVELGNSNEKATREFVFELVYNTMMNLEIGNYSVVKGIVLENNRVEALGKDEIVVEVIKEVQKANYADASRYEKGDQIRLVVPADVADVEELLGKVADFTITAGNKVVRKPKVDETYTYVQGTVYEATRNKINVGGREYTVELEERYKDRDERIFRTYHNDKDYKYEDFYKDVKAADYARVTVKNGKVLLIDAYTFEDIAPVQETKRDGLDVYVYNDYRDARIEKFEPRALVLGFNDGKFSRIERKDIKTDDVVHVYNRNRMIVRQDAKVAGVYDKVERDRYGNYLAHVGDEAYLINDTDYRRPVFAHDSKSYATLYAKYAQNDLAEFYKEEVVILKDINGDLQLFGANVEYNEGMAIVKQILARGQVKFVQPDDEALILDEDYSSYISTHNLGTGKTTTNQRLNAFNTRDLTFVKGAEDKIDTLVRIATETEMKEAKKELKSAKAVDMNNSFIRMKDEFAPNKDRYQVLDRTNVFVIDTVYGGISGTTVAELQAGLKADSKVEAFVLTDKEVSNLIADRVISDRNRITDKDDIAHTIVFMDVDYVDPSLKGETVLVTNVYTARTPHYVVGQKANNERVERTAEGWWVDLSGLNPDDIVSLKLTKDDDELVADWKPLIPSKQVKTDSYRVVGGELEYSRYEHRRLYLQDAEQEKAYIKDLKDNPRLDPKDSKYSTEYWLAKGVEEFGSITMDSVVTFHLDGNGDIDVIRVYRKDTPVTAHAKDDSDKTAEGVVTYINSDDTQLVIDGEIYRANDDTIVKDADGNVIGLGDFSAIAVGDDVVVEGNVYTITLTKTEKDAAAEAEALAEAIEAAEAAQADYLAAGGLDTDAVYVAVQDALDADPQVRADIEAATDALVAATAALTADQDMVNAELAKVTDPVVLTGSTAVTDANIKTAVEALVDLNKVTVTVSANATEGWDVTLTSKVEGSTAEKTVAATNEDTLAVEAAIAKVPATLNPVEGTDTNVKDMVEAAIDDDASTTFVTALDASGNTQVGSDGAITYDTTEVTGDVVFTITVGSMSDTVTVSVTVPMSAAAADQAMVDAELAKVSDVELANGTDLTADQSALVKAEVEKSVDLNKVTVTVTKGSDDNTYNVKLDSRVAAGTANKDITVTVAAE